MSANDLHESHKMRLVDDAKALVEIATLAGASFDKETFDLAIDLVGAPMMWTRDLYALRGLTLRGPHSIGSSEAAVFFSTPAQPDALIAELTSRFHDNGAKTYAWRLVWNDGRRDTDAGVHQMTGEAFAAAARLLTGAATRVAA